MREDVAQPALALDQRQIPEVTTIQYQQIESTEGRGIAAQQQVIELRASPLVKAGDLAINLADKRALIQEFRKHCSKGTIIALRRGNESQPEGTDYESETDPEKLVKLVNSILKPKAQ